MGLGSLIGDIRRALTVKSAWDRLKEASKMGHGKTAVFALLSAVSTAVVAQFSGACPALLTDLPAIATAVVGGVITYLMRKPVQSPGVKALLTGAFGAAVAGGMQALSQACGADFVHQIPALATAGLWVGLGLYLRAPHEA